MQDQIRRAIERVKNPPPLSPEQKQALARELAAKRKAAQTAPPTTSLHFGGAQKKPTQEALTPSLVLPED